MEIAKGVSKLCIDFKAGNQNQPLRLINNRSMHPVI